MPVATVASCDRPLRWRGWAEGVEEARRSGRLRLVSCDPAWTTSGQRLDLVVRRDRRLGDAIDRHCVPIRLDPLADRRLARSIEIRASGLGGIAGPPTILLTTADGTPLVPFPSLAYEGVDGAHPSLAAVIESAREIGSAGGPDGGPPVAVDADHVLCPRRYERLLDAVGASASARETADAAFDLLLASGVRDQVGEGFHRAARDARWTVPHFEKRLDQNAAMSACLARASVVLARPDLARVAIATAAMVRSHLDRDPDAQAIAADAAFYTWTPREFASVVPRAVAKTAALRFGMTRADVPHVLIVAQSTGGIVGQGHLSEREVEAEIAASVAALARARAHRPAPAVVSRRDPVRTRLIERALARTARWLG